MSWNMVVWAFLFSTGISYNLIWSGPNWPHPPVGHVWQRLAPGVSSKTEVKEAVSWTAWYHEIPNFLIHCHCLILIFGPAVWPLLHGKYRCKCIEVDAVLWIDYAKAREIQIWPGFGSPMSPLNFLEDAVCAQLVLAKTSRIGSLKINAISRGFRTLWHFHSWASNWSSHFRCLTGQSTTWIFQDGPARVATVWSSAFAGGPSGLQAVRCNFFLSFSPCWEKQLFSF